MSAPRRLRTLRASERGSEVVQSVVAVSLVLLAVFAVVQVGGMMLSISRLTADLSRACRQMDTAGLALAADRERFVAEEVLGAATQLKPELLQVRNVRMSAAVEEGAGQAPGQGTASDADAGVLQRTDAARVSFDVAYELPSLAAFPGLAHRTIARHVVCEHVEGRVVEVGVGP